MEDLRLDSRTRVGRKKERFGSWEECRPLLTTLASPLISLCARGVVSLSFLPLPILFIISNSLATLSLCFRITFSFWAVECSVSPLATTLTPSLVSPFPSIRLFLISALLHSSNNNSKHKTPDQPLSRKRNPRQRRQTNSQSQSQSQEEKEAMKGSRLWTDRHSQERISTGLLRHADLSSSALQGR